MKKQIILTFLLAAFVFFTACGTSNDSATAQQNAAEKTDKKASVDFTWYRDWDSGIEAARKEKKPVVIDFYADWCTYCVKMDKETFAADEIKSRLSAGWVGIKIDAEDKTKTATVDGKTMTYPELVSYNRVTGFPTFVFLDAEGNRVTPISGFVPKERFGHILDFLKDELYKKDVDFQEYVKSKS